MSAAAEVAAKDPAIKLFGWTIAVPECHDLYDTAERLDLAGADARDICDEVNSGDIRDVVPMNPKELDQKVANSTSDINDSHDDDQQACVTNEGEPCTDHKPEAANASASSQDKTLKKPDKILPCPRCNSMETKFCYYNNYNVNQPRHFCKNCQRYWTAGGTMRNVPVGAGRRKNKHSASHYRQVMMSADGSPSPRADISEIAQCQVLPCRLSTPADSLKGNGTVLKFGPEGPLCEPMATVLSLEDQKRTAEVKIMASGENGKVPFHTSSGAASDCIGKDISENPAQLEQNTNLGSCNGPNGLPIMQPLQFYRGPPWAYPWNPAWNSVAALPAIPNAHEAVYGQENAFPNTIPWCQPPMITAPTFCPPAIPFPYIPASFWGYMSSWPNGACNAPWVGGTCSASSSAASASSSGCSDSQSPRLGKHSRDGNVQGGEKMEKSLWVPKTLRIDDPDAAAKSSIWATLGIKLHQKEPLAKGGLFKSFHSGHESKDQKLDSSHFLNANPAALNRSNTFQEST